MKPYRPNHSNVAARSSIWPLVIAGLLTGFLSGCYIPTEGIRDANPGASATPPWPYDPAIYPQGQRGNPGQYPQQQYYPQYPQHYNPPGYAASPIPNSQLNYQPTPGYPQQAMPYGSNTGYPATVGNPGQKTAHGNNPSSATPPPPSKNMTYQYEDWLIDGPEGRNFAYYLSAGYRRFAKHEDNQHDFENAAKFLFRAGAVDRGERVEPELLTMRTLPAYAVDDLLYARQRLMSVLNRGAAMRFPKLSASAQVHFDCWMEQQEENTQPQDIAQCRRAYEVDIIRLETAMVERVQQAAAPCPAPALARPVCDTTPLLVLFDLGKHDLTNAAKEVVQQAIDYSRRSGNLPLVVSGHADRSGSDVFNDALSRRRLDAVIAALENSGFPKDHLARADYFGETKPRVETADGVRNPENRRVEIRLACNVPATQAQCPAMPMAQPACAGTMSGHAHCGTPAFGTR